MRHEFPSVPRQSLSISFSTGGLCLAESVFLRTCLKTISSECKNPGWFHPTFAFQFLKCFWVVFSSDLHCSQWEANCQEALLPSLQLQTWVGAISKTSPSSSVQCSSGTLVGGCYDSFWDSYVGCAFFLFLNFHFLFLCALPMTSFGWPIF